MIGGLFNISFCLIFALFFVACGTNQPQYVDSRDFVSFGLDNHDIDDILQKQVDSLLNHPWGKCMINNETKCQIESIKEYGAN